MHDGDNNLFKQLQTASAIHVTMALLILSYIILCNDGLQGFKICQKIASISYQPVFTLHRMGLQKAKYLQTRWNYMKY